MNPNVGGLDLLGTGLYFKSWLGLIGIVPILTGTFRFCPAGLPFGISSCKTKA